MPEDKSRITENNIYFPNPNISTNIGSRQRIFVTLIYILNSDNKDYSHDKSKTTLLFIINYYNFN